MMVMPPVVTGLPEPSRHWSVITEDTVSTSMLWLVPAVKVRLGLPAVIKLAVTVPAPLICAVVYADVALFI